MRLQLALFLALTFPILSASTASSGCASQDSRATAAVEKRAEEFIHAFINLDWERFRSFFATDATAFFPPSANRPRRADGKAEIEDIFRTVFEGARKRKSHAPYFSIEPKELKVQMVGDVAIVSFHLEDPDLFGRRTIIFQRRDGQWLIVHLHASGVMVQK